MPMIKLSVIIPVYNVEKYLRDCLDSVIWQNLLEIEIICVNDGSTDGSEKILEEYSKKDQRIIVINKENGGLSSARNCGMKLARGCYILFLDSDDYLLERESLEEVYKKAIKDNLDELFFNADVKFENEKVREEFPNYIDYYKRKGQYPQVVTGKDMFVRFWENWDFKPNVGMQLFKKDFLEKNSLSFCEVAHEDEIFTLQCITLAERTGYLDKAYLGRRIRENSIMTGSKKAKSIYGYYRGVKELTQFAEKYLVDEEGEFFECYLSRVQVIMGLASDEYMKENPENREAVLNYVTGKERIDFILSIKEWGKVARLLRENSKINREKVEINRKLQKTYDEKKERGEEIKRLKKELNYSLEREKKLKNSYSYKVGKVATYLPRRVKKILK